MTYYIGLDLGTSATKLLLLGADGAILKSVTKAYPISRPQPHWSEQDPAEWIGVRGGELRYEETNC